MVLINSITFSKLHEHCQLYSNCICTSPLNSLLNKQTLNFNHNSPPTSPIFFKQTKHFNSNIFLLFKTKTNPLPTALSIPCWGGSLSKILSVTKKGTKIEAKSKEKHASGTNVRSLLWGWLLINPHIFRCDTALWIIDSHEVRTPRFFSSQTMLLYCHSSTPSWAGQGRGTASYSTFALFPPPDLTVFLWLIHLTSQLTWLIPMMFMPLAPHSYYQLAHKKFYVCTRSAVPTAAIIKFSCLFSELIIGWEKKIFVWVSFGRKLEQKKSKIS